MREPEYTLSKVHERMSAHISLNNTPQNANQDSLHTHAYR